MYWILARQQQQLISIKPELQREPRTKALVITQDRRSAKRLHQSVNLFFFGDFD